MATMMDGQRIIMSGVVLSNGDSEVVISEGGQTLRFRFEQNDDSISGTGEPEDISILLPAGREAGSIASGFGLARDHDRVMVNYRVDWVLPSMRQIIYTVYEEQQLEGW
ncbi:MAG TPA: hypothetical protein VF589_07005 [Allosphingosinicella sp.]|jgi:hypothetical protein